MKEEQIWGGHQEIRRDKKDRDAAGVRTGVPVARRQAGGQGARQEKPEWREFSQQTPLSIHKAPSADEGLQQREDWQMKAEDLMAAYAIDSLVADAPGDGQGRSQPGSLFCWGSMCHTAQQV